MLYPLCDKLKLWGNTYKSFSLVAKVFSVFHIIHSIKQFKINPENKIWKYKESYTSNICKGF